MDDCSGREASCWVVGPVLCIRLLTTWLHGLVERMRHLVGGWATGPLGTTLWAQALVTAVAHCVSDCKCMKHDLTPRACREQPVAGCEQWAAISCVGFVIVDALQVWQARDVRGSSACGLSWGSLHCAEDSSRDSASVNMYSSERCRAMCSVH